MRPAAFLVLALLLALAGCASNSTPSPSTSTPSSTTTTTTVATTTPSPTPSTSPTPATVPTAPTIPTPTSPTPIAQDPDAVIITIKSFAFVEDGATIKAGTKVQWKNDDAVPHRVVEDNGTWDTGDIPAGGFSKVVVVNTPGTYHYHCQIHPTMKAVITYTSPTPSTPTTPTPVVHDVAISGFAFKPATLTIKAGDSVKFTNADPVSHSATGTGWDTGVLGANADATIAFPNAGTFAYHCKIHSSMTGTITVT